MSQTFTPPALPSNRQQIMLRRFKHYCQEDIAEFAQIVSALAKDLRIPPQVVLTGADMERFTGCIELRLICEGQELWKKIQQQAQLFFQDEPDMARFCIERMEGETCGLAEIAAQKKKHSHNGNGQQPPYQR